MEVNPMIRAALYLRSSKDRSDVSIDAQRRTLGELAKAKNFAIVAEFVDAVESGKDDQRPGFQRLLAAIDDRKRGWDHILVLDTSRIARRRALAILVEERCRRQGITLIFSNLPDADPITDMLLRSILQAFDELHSLTSKSKGLSGMAENVRQGFRAGGRAPRGYRLQREATGAIRDGEPVTKSRLVPADDAAIVRAYLQARARGLPRSRALEIAGAAWPVASLVDMERNARTYAGHTAWNRHAEQDQDGYIGGAKHRPESEWVTARNTHAALISDDEAAAILAQLEAKKGRRARTGKRVYLLAGLLHSPDGEAWHGDQGYYRLGKGGKRVLAEQVDRAALACIMADMASDEMAKQIAERYRLLAQEQGKKKSRLPELRRKLAESEAKATRLADLLAETSAPDALLRQIERLEGERESLLADIAEAEQEREVSKTLKAITPEQIKRVLIAIMEDLNQHDPQALKDALGQIVESIKLNPATLEVTGTYRASLITGDNMASPGEAEPIPGRASRIVRHRRVTKR
jgi:site-specific DNA recombinase